MDCDFGHDYLWNSRFPEKPAPAFLAVFDTALIGQVRPNVTEVNVRLSDGDLAKIRPVRAYGRPWIGLVIPDGVTAGLVTAYAGDAEFAHSTPFVDQGGYQFLSWLPPGDAGPARSTKVVSATIEPGASLYTGPWGNCVGWSPEHSCFPVGWQVKNWVDEYPSEPRTPRSVLMSVAPKASYLLLTLSTGRHQRIPVVTGAGVAFVALRVRASPGIVAWGVYDSRGRELSSGLGPPDRVA